MTEKVFYQPVIELEYVPDGSLENIYSDYVFNSIRKATSFAMSKANNYCIDPSFKNYKVSFTILSVKLCK